MVSFFREFLPPSLTGVVVPGQMLPVEIEACAILPQKPLEAYPNHRHPRFPYAVVSGTCHCDSDPNSDIAACHKVGFPPLNGEADGQLVHSVLCIRTHQVVHWDKKR